MTTYLAWIALDPRRTAGERIAAGPGEAVSYRSAAVVRQLGDLDADELEFTTTTRRQTRRPDVRIHRGKIADNDWGLVDGLPVTTPLRTIADLAAARIDRGHLAGVVRDAIVDQSVPMAQVATTLAPYARAYGQIAGDGPGLVDALVAEAGIPRSVLEIAASSSRHAQRASDASVSIPGAVQRGTADG